MPVRKPPEHILKKPAAKKKPAAALKKKRRVAGTSSILQPRRQVSTNCVCTTARTDHTSNTRTTKMDGGCACGTQRSQATQKSRRAYSYDARMRISHARSCKLHKMPMAECGACRGAGSRPREPTHDGSRQARRAPKMPSNPTGWASSRWVTGQHLRRTSRMASH